MVRNLFCILTLFFIFFSSKSAYALDVVYPSAKKVTINAESTFIFGSVKPNAALTINSESVKIWDDGVFVQIVPLYYGENKITVEETLNGKKESVVYVITRNKKKAEKYPPLPYAHKQDGTYLYTKTIKENATVREKPSLSSKRVIDLPVGIVLYLEGQKGDYYKIDAKGSGEFWIHRSNIDEPIILSDKISSKVKNPEYYSDKFYNYMKVPLSYPVFYTLNQDGKKLKLTLFGIENPKNEKHSLGNLEFVFENDNQVLGYDAYYEDDKFILRRAKIPDKVNPYKPLFGVRIFVDAGHGGIEKGAVGPTRVNEKDINLAIAKKLITMLENEGAIVSYSRIDDRQVSLYDRVKMAKDNNAFISLSIHNNSLPNGKNPYVNHGCETHYYNDNAKVLAYIIKNNLVLDLGLKDNGLHKSSFALNRSTNPVSVLVEVAYMINPDEYKKLRNPDFQTKTAESLCKSLKEFMILLKK